MASPATPWLSTKGFARSYVVIGESTEMDIYRGHRGRTEISVTFKGRTLSRQRA